MLTGSHPSGQARALEEAGEALKLTGRELEKVESA
jgi:hypothetical protein